MKTKVKKYTVWIGIPQYAKSAIEAKKTLYSLEPLAREHKLKVTRGWSRLKEV